MNKREKCFSEGDSVEAQVKKESIIQHIHPLRETKEAQATKRRKERKAEKKHFQRAYDEGYGLSLAIRERPPGYRCQNRHNSARKNQPNQSLWQGSNEYRVVTNPQNRYTTKKET